ncbi:MAG: aminotransferase class IV [Polyangiaceae bacterium]
MREMVWLDGHLMPAAEASVPIGDRGLLFGDGVYEVYRLYGGRPFRRAEHLARFARSAAGIRLVLPAVDWDAVQGALLQANGLQVADAVIYAQATRGAAATRAHAFPASGAHTLFVTARPLGAPPPALYRDGAAAIVRPDQRWGRVDIKSINLLPNVLAAQEAAEAGAWEALLVRDGALTEGTRTNLFALVDGRLRTHPEGAHILSGITRAAVLEAAHGAGVEVDEEAVGIHELRLVRELFVCGTTAEVLPVTTLEGRPVGDGRRGPVTARLMDELARLVARETAG